MSYTADPVRDADRYLTDLDAANKRHDSQRNHYATEIMETVTETVRKVPSTRLNVPRAGAHSVETMTLSDLVSDAVSYGSPLVALMKMIEKSDCPHVAEFRRIVAQDYIDRCASDIAEVSL